MPVGFSNLSGDVQAALLKSYPDIGQTFYLVDSNYRTQAQGWGKSDHTGPLDLWGERNPGYVFRTGDYSADYLAIQAAIDAMVDFRGDTLYYTPGNYSIATALAQNVPDARWVGSPVGHPSQARATITAAVAASIGVTAASDRLEVAFLRFVPLTASHIWAVATGANRFHFHHFQYDADGIAANAATQFMLADGTMDDSLFEHFYFTTDTQQGPMFELDGTVTNAVFQYFRHFHNAAGAGALAISLLDIDGAGCTGIVVGPGHGQIGGGGTVTTLIDMVDMTATATNVTIKEFTGSVGYATNTTIVTTAGAVNDVDLVSSWIATVEGGAGRAAYVGAA
jgi:hypothetical protein